MKPDPWSPETITALAAVEEDPSIAAAEDTETTAEAVEVTKGGIADAKISELFFARRKGVVVVVKLAWYWEIGPARNALPAAMTAVRLSGWRSNAGR